jgi:very-short-patch-repair endonuclease
VDEIYLTRHHRRLVRRQSYEQVTRGVHVRRGSARDLAARCGAIQQALPREAVFSHYTAARIRAWQLPWLPAWLPDFASLPGGGTHLERRGLYVARTDEATAGYELRSGLRLATACATLAQIAQDLSLLDLIATLDSALQCGDCTANEVEASLRPHQRGASRLRRALAHADGRAESWWETLLRLVHVWAGIDVEPQYEIFDARGNFVARGDLWIVGTRRIHEYDGAHHDDPATRRRDLRRDKALHRIRWERYGFVGEDIVHRPYAIVADADAALGRPYRPAQLRRWRAEAARSTLSAAGRTALARRLRRFERF